MQRAETSAPRPAGSTTNPTGAMLNVFLTLGLFVVSFIGFLIAPWVVLGVAALLYAGRQGVKNRRRGKSENAPESDGAIRAFGLGAPE